MVRMNKMITMRLNTPPYSINRKEDEL